MEMGSDAETEMDYTYRTELLSPPPSPAISRPGAWDIDKFRLPQRHSAAQPFGFRRLLRMPSTFFFIVFQCVCMLLCFF